MRPSCPDCARKHLAQAAILLGEAQQGYPDHVFLAIGHLAEAGDEILQADPRIAASIRAHRKRLEDDHDYAVPCMQLIQLINGVRPCKNCGKKQSAPLGAGGSAVKSVVPFPPRITEDDQSPEQLAAKHDAMVVKGWDEFPTEEDGAKVFNGPDGQPAFAVQSIKKEDVGKRPASPPAAHAALEDRTDRAAQAAARVRKQMEGRLHRIEPTVAQEPLRQTHVLVATALGEFSSSYSLTSVIRDQLQALIDQGYSVTLLMMQNGGDSERRRLVWRIPQGVSIHSALPNVGWREDELTADKVNTLIDALKHILTELKPDVVITHDWLLQSWYAALAAAVHAKPGPQSIQWWHQVHSLVGARPTDPLVANYRARLPSGHRLLVANNSGREKYAEYYQTSIDNIDVLPNSRDLMNALEVSGRVRALVETTCMMTADIVQVYPVSAPRMEAKGVFKLIELFAALKSKRGTRAKLLIVDSDAFGEEGIKQVQQVTKLKAELNLQDEVICASQVVQMGSAGLTGREVMDLQRFANFFCFPSISESCGLTMLEAALSGHFLVLNSDLPQLQEYIPHDTPGNVWLPFGSLQSGTWNRTLPPITLDAWAIKILDLFHGYQERVGRSTLRERCSSDAMGQTLRLLITQHLPIKESP